jgi:O-antigen biosynthesis protein
MGTLAVLPLPLQKLIVRSYQSIAPVAYGASSILKARSYRRWVKLNDLLSTEDRRAILSEIGGWHKCPLISIAIPVFNTPQRYLRTTLSSVVNQLYPNWELCLADDGSTAPHVALVLRE